MDDPLLVVKGQRRYVVRRVVAFGLAALIAVILAGFMLGGYLDATDTSAITGASQLKQLPTAVRVIIELVIGVPLVFGIALYFFLETADLLWFLSAPFRMLSARARRR